MHCEPTVFEKSDQCVWWNSVCGFGELTLFNAPTLTEKSTSEHVRAVMGGCVDLGQIYCFPTWVEAAETELDGGRENWWIVDKTTHSISSRFWYLCPGLEAENLP